MHNPRPIVVPDPAAFTFRRASSALHTSAGLWLLGLRATAKVWQCSPKKRSKPRRLTLPSSGLTPAAQAWPSFHSGPSPRRLREPLMSNVKPPSMNANSAPSCATRPSLRSSFPVGTRALSLSLGLTSRVVRAVRASPASAPPKLCQEGATLPCSLSVPLAKQSIQNRAFVHLRYFMKEKVSSLVPHELSPLGIRCCPPTSAVIQLVSKRAATQRSWWRHPRPNPFIERTRSGGASLALISFWAKPAPPPRAAHVKR